MSYQPGMLLNDQPSVCNSDSEFEDNAYPCRKYRDIACYFALIYAPFGVIMDNAIRAKTRELAQSRWSLIARET